MINQFNDLIAGNAILINFDLFFEVIIRNLGTVGIKYPLETKTL